MIGWVVDDEGPDKAAAGGAGPFAISLAEREQDGDAHLARCPSCKELGEPFGCVGLVPTPLATVAERWLVDRLPEDIESLPGFLLRKAVGDFDYTGAFGKALRSKGLLEAPGPFTRHFGPFFRRFTVSSEQLLEELLGAGDVAPTHALACLIHLGAIAVDGRVLGTLDEGQIYGELVEHRELRAKRTKCTIELSDGDPEAIAALKRYLRGLWVGFALDASVKIFGENA
jgi:hypothetical protein